MIIYFANRKMQILGQATTSLSGGFIIADDKKTEDAKTGIAAFSCYVGFDIDSRMKLEEMTEVGNYILRNNGNENECYTIIDAEIDTKEQNIYIYAEDEGLDLLNEIAGEFEDTEAHNAEWYVNKYAADAGFEIGINEIPDTMVRQLKFENTTTATERLAEIAEAFGGFEISYSFDIKGLSIAHRYINIHEKRGDDKGVQLRLNRDIDRIKIIKSAANLATELLVTGGTPEDADVPITLAGYVYDDGDFYVDGTSLKSRNAFEKWGRLNGGHIAIQFEDSAVIQSELCKNAVTELKKICDTEVNYEIDINDLPKNVRIGDRVNIIDDAGELYVSTRILTLETSVTNETVRATLGENLIKTSGISKKVTQLAANFAKSTVSVKRALTVAKNAKTTAATAQKQADTALAGANKAQATADKAQTSADTATQSAEKATTAANKAQAAVDVVESTVSSIQTTVTKAQEAADLAYEAANIATEKAEEAKTASANAVEDAEEAKTKAETAKTKAESAIEKADTAKATATEAQGLAEQASTVAASAKADAVKAAEDIEALDGKVETVTTTMQTDYTRKSEFTETTASLQTQIEQNSTRITLAASQITTIDETANNAAELAEQAQSKAQLAQTQADQATAEANKAQRAADQAASAAASAQSEADTAKAAAATAQSVADKADADLAAAKADLATVSSRVDATDEEIATAKAAVSAAQKAADKANADAEAAASKATAAQNTANTAVSNATKAQETADAAADKADIAHLLAEEAKGNASAAQATADQAVAAATAAQSTADTAKTNALNAQATANQAAANAQAAQNAADAADAKAAQAATDLATAKQNLAEVTSRVDATAEEVEAAQSAVVVAQAAADKAKADAVTAQATADTAKAEADKAQAAADKAQKAADDAQEAADKAQEAADKAQQDVNALAVRVTDTEARIDVHDDRIDLMATKDEVTQTLGGYYTKTETDAAINVKTDEINLSVDSKIEGVQVGGRNLLKNSRHITLQSNNSALYPVTYTTKKENGREYRRYTRSEITLNPTTMSLYSAIPVTQITKKLTNEQVTLSFFIRCSHSTTTNTMNVFVINGATQNFGTTKTHNIGTEWKQIKLTATITQDYEVVDSNLLRFNPLMIVIPNGVIDTFYIDVCEWKIEKGNKATDWSPAPEDIDEKFNDYSTTQEMNAAIDVKAQGITSNVQANYTTKDDFNGLSVGGRNLVRDSSMRQKTDFWSFPENSLYNFTDGYCAVYRTATSGSRIFYVQSSLNNALLKPDKIAGETFTLSAEVKKLDGYNVTNDSSIVYRCETSELSVGYQNISIGLGDVTTEWKKVSKSYTFGNYNFDGACRVLVALGDIANTGYCVRNIKLEKGNRATDWTPAPEDTSSAVDNLQETMGDYAGYEERIQKAESSIEQLADQISMLVQNAGKASQMVFDEDSATWSFNTGEIDDKIASNEENISVLQTGATTTNENVSKLEDKITSWEEHVSITTHEDEPCLILYEEDSNYKQYITNTRRIITETLNGTETVLSEVTTNTATYDNVIAKEKSQIGGFAWKRSDANRISLVWEGED